MILDHDGKTPEHESTTRGYDSFAFDLTLVLSRSRGQSLLSVINISAKQCGGQRVEWCGRCQQRSGSDTVVMVPA